MKNNEVRDENKHYHEDVTYDSKKENWSGLMSLLLIPLFITMVGWGVVSTFKLPARNDVAENPQKSTDNNFGIGIGGGPGTQVTPYKVPSITLSPNQLESGDNLYIIQ